MVGERSQRLGSVVSMTSNTAWSRNQSRSSRDPRTVRSAVRSILTGCKRTSVALASPAARQRRSRSCRGCDLSLVVQGATTMSPSSTPRMTVGRTFQSPGRSGKSIAASITAPARTSVHGMSLGLRARRAAWTTRRCSWCRRPRSAVRSLRSSVRAIRVLLRRSGTKPLADCLANVGQPCSHPRIKSEARNGLTVVEAKIQEIATNSAQEADAVGSSAQLRGVCADELGVRPLAALRIR